MQLTQRKMALVTGRAVWHGNACLGQPSGWGMGQDRKQEGSFWSVCCPLANAGPSWVFSILKLFISEPLSRAPDSSQKPRWKLGCGEWLDGGPRQDERRSGRPPAVGTGMLSAELRDAVCWRSVVLHA
jgi:hypothetical protein